jgi:hypothetical protein
MWIKIDSEYLTFTDVNAFRPPIKKMDKIILQFMNELNVAFDMCFEGNQDEKWVRYKFTEDVDMTEELFESCSDLAFSINNKS